MEVEQYGQLMKEFGELKGTVTAGFSAITGRMDIANHRTSKLEDKVEVVEKAQANSDGRLTAFGWIFGGIATVLGLVIGAVQIFLK